MISILTAVCLPGLFTAKITNVELPKNFDGRSSGTAFVTFDTVDAAGKAIEVTILWERCSREKWPPPYEFPLTFITVLPYCVTALQQMLIFG